MQGALYFPYIRVPSNAWWTRTLLYWDSAATITPTDFIDDPELHDRHTLELIRSGLLYQVFPQYASDRFVPSFNQFVMSHSPGELQQRRNNFQMGKATHVHKDKFVDNRCVGWLEQQGLAQHASERWSLVEESTAGELMAALALSLCEAADQREWSRQDGHYSERWVPVTDHGPSAGALLSGLRPVSDGQEMKVELRVRGQLQLAEIRSVVLPAILPVPEHPMSVEGIIRFRKQHGDLLPQFRRDMEDRLQKMADLEDPVLRQLSIDQLEDEVRERTEQVGAYLSEARVGRILKSKLVSLFKMVPIAKEIIGVATEWYKDNQRYTDFERDPLAYLAFANAAFSPVQKYGIDVTGRPLVSA